MIGIESIEFEADHFNDIYHEIDEAFNDINVSYIFPYGGSSSAKTHSVCQRLLIYTLEGENNNSIVFKRVSSHIDKTIFMTFKKIINIWGIGEYFKIQKHHIECKLTGSFISFSGLDDADKVKGLEGYKKIFIDELDQVEFYDYEQLETRLRGEEGQQIIGAFNPVSEFCFIKTEIFDKEELREVPSSINLKQVNKDGDMVILRTNYLENIWVSGDGKGGGFIDKKMIKKFEKFKKRNINHYNIYALGLWGHLRTGGEFLKQFDEKKHVSLYPYDPSLPLHVSFDENVLPYLTCNVFQLFPGGALRQIDEIMLKDPLNTLKDTCAEFMKRYGNNAHGVFVYGDATSKKADTKIEKGKNFFLLIKGYLSKLKPIFRVPKANPSVTMSKNFVNDILAGEIEGCEIGIDSKCRNSINDYQYCLEDENGKVNKKVIRNKETGQSYQEFGHACDTLRYIVVVIFLEKYKKFMKG